MEYIAHPDGRKTCFACKNDHTSVMTEAMAKKKYKMLITDDDFFTLRNERKTFRQTPNVRGVQTVRTSRYYWDVDLEKKGKLRGWK